MKNKKELKVIFLDIDGVLNHENWYHESRFIRKKDEGNIDPKSVALINEIIIACDAKIIISSSWKSDWHETCNLLYKSGLIEDSIIGNTPFYEYTIQDKGLRNAITRGNEILSSINEHDILYYVIIDDNSDMLLSQKDHFIKINEFTGITQKDVKTAISILNKKEEEITSRKYYKKWKK